MAKMKRLFLTVALTAFLVATCGSAAFAVNLAEELTVPEMARFLINNVFYFDYDKSELQTDDVQQMIESLDDKYSQYFTPEQYKAYTNELDNERPMVGIYYVQEEGTGMVVAGTIPYSPAESAGLQAGDIITSVSGQSTIHLTQQEAAATLSVEDGQDIPLVVKRGEDTLNITLTAKVVVVPSVDYKMLEDGIGYLRIAEFDAATGREVKTGISVLRTQGMKALLLDLRSCPGGMVNSMIEVADLFVPSGPVAFFRYKGGREEFAKVNGENYYSDLPVITLVNEYTASAAEFLAGAMQDASTTVLIGNKTFGKGLMQNVYSLKDGSGITLTTAQVFTRSYQDIYTNGGVTPDIVTTDADEQMKIGLEMCKNMLFTGKITLRIGSKTLQAPQGFFEMDVAPTVVDGVAYAPLRQIASAMGAWVDWQNGIITIVNGGDKFTIDPVSQKIKKDGYNYNAQIIERENTTLIPVRFFGEHMGADVVWNEYDNTVQISR